MPPQKCCSGMAGNPAQMPLKPLFWSGNELARRPGELLEVTKKFWGQEPLDSIAPRPVIRFRAPGRPRMATTGLCGAERCCTAFAVRMFCSGRRSCAGRRC